MPACWCGRTDLDRLVVGGLAVIGLAGVGLVSTFSLSPQSGASLSAGDTFTCTVTGVHDGDGPIYCAEGPKVRLSAIAAREVDGSCIANHPCPSASADDAKAELLRLAGGQTLRCESVGMTYKRVAAWCWRPDGTQVNCAMVESGTVALWPKYDPDGRMCA